MPVLGIESSCDETAAALVGPDGRVLRDVVASQIAVHAPYGGIVPELAARAHVTHLVPVLREALDGVDLDTIDAVAVTRGPGLVGALLTGLSCAKGIAFALDRPLVGVDHLLGHLLSIHLRYDEDAPAGPAYPYVALLVSGGHTALYEVRSATEATILGQTRDDAAGEAFDKVAKLLGLAYPGGPVIDRLAAAGDPRAVDLPTPLASRRHFDFSFSGLKTAVARHVEREGRPDSERALQDLCASFQRAVVGVLVAKAVHACQTLGVPRLALGGGVAANSGLRARAAARCARAGVALHLPPRRACTDNAAMIAYAGAARLAAGHAPDDLTLAAYSRSPDLKRGKFPRRRPGAEGGPPPRRREARGD